MGVDARMYVVTKHNFSDRELKRLAYDIGVAFGSDVFWRFEDRHNIDRAEAIHQDGPTLPAPKGKNILQVHLAGRYYGVGYERGDLPTYIAVAEWLERRIDDASILYGGDSSGILAQSFDAPARAKLLDHFASFDGRAYFRHMGEPREMRSPVCGLCDEPMQQFGFGGKGKMGGFACGGCGAKLATDDGGQTFHELERQSEWHKPETWGDEVEA